MSAVITVDKETGEVLQPADLPMEAYLIPENAEAMVAQANASQRAAFGHHWRTAAMVYAWTDDLERGRPKKNAAKLQHFSFREFAKLGIRGLENARTVSKYRRAWEAAIDAGLCTEAVKGQPVMLPAVEFQPAAKLPANFSSESNEWYTPPVYIRSVRNVLGEIDLDPCSCEKANETVMAAQIFTIEDQSQDLEWHGRVFMNPPYGTTEDKESRAGLFCRKLISEYEAGRVSEAIILVNSVHSQKWQKPLYNFPVCFVDHRIEFVDQLGNANPNPTFGNIFVYLGRDAEKFAAEFSAHGYVMEPVR